MSEKADLAYLRHLLDSLEAVEEFSKNLKKEELFSNRLKQSAIIREMEVIGEAVKNLSSALKRKHSKTDWKRIAGTRDKLIHHYFGVDLNIIWDIIKQDLPPLKEEVKKILEEVSS